MFGNPFKKTDDNAVWLLNEAAKRRKHTPDEHVLEQYELQLLFIYDQMREGHYESERIGSESISGGTAYTQNHYSHWKKKLGLRTESIAMHPTTKDKYNPLKKQYDAYPARIQGEIYAVRPQLLYELDALKENMYTFNRIRVRLLVPYREEVYIKERDTVERLTGKPLINGSKLFTEEKVEEVKAWMYVGIPEYWGQLLDGGYLFAPVQIYTPKSLTNSLGVYSSFTSLEYDL